MSPPTASPQPAWHHPRLHQQAILALLTADDDGPRQRVLTELGLRVRTVFAGLPMPLLAVQSDFSRLEGTAPPQAWRTFLAALHDGGPTAPSGRRGGNHPAGAGAVYAITELVARIHAEGWHAAPAEPPAPPASGPDAVWAVLADRDDCAGLPTALESWGPGSVGLGATVRLPGGDVVLLASDEDARCTLCQLLSRRLMGDGRSDEESSCAGLIALVRDAVDGQHLRARGAEVWWRADAFPEVRDVPFPIACVPLLRHLDDEDRASAALRDAIRRGGTVDPRFSPGLAAVDLLDLPRRYAGHEDQLAAGAALRARLRWRPQRTWILPHLVGEFTGRDADVELRLLAESGLARRYGSVIAAEVRARLETELDIIRHKRFAAYLLTVWLLTRNRTTCGRGSGASSLVCYLLEITNVDPIAAHLRFDRFLAPDRTDPPDLDVDFPWDERDDVFASVFARFGSAHVAMVATHQRLRRDGALREAAKAYGLGGSGDADDPRWPTIAAQAETLVGAPRHFGLHCGGIVVTEPPIRDIVPIHRAAKRIATHDDTAAGVPTIAWEKDGAEYIRLVKIDLLGNRSLAVIRDALADLRADGITIDEATWDPTRDLRTRELVARGDTLGCFYVESPATRQLQAKVGSGDFDRLVVHSSMIRPAGSPFVDAYIRRHAEVIAHGGIPPGRAAEWFPHPALRGLLSETYGVFAYQEDIMGAAEGLAGFTSEQSNALRKALGRNDTAATMPRLALAFARGCRAKGVADTVAAEVWRMIASFAGYSFCKAHSASYAMVSFQCAWLKAHHPAHFLARVIANEGGFYSASAYVEEARRLGVRILAPCVHRGAWATRREGGDAIRLGFHLVRGLSRATVDGLGRAQPFAGIADLLARTPCASDELIALREAGALDVLTPDLDEARRGWLVALLIRRPPRRDHVPGNHVQGDRIDFGVPIAPRDPVPPVLPPLDTRERELRRRDRLGGITVPCHLLKLLALPRRPRQRTRDVAPANVGRRIDLVAVTITSKEVLARAGEDDDGHQTFRDMAFVTLEDETGLAEATWFPDAWAAHAHVLRSGRPLRVRGRVEVAFGVATLTVDQVTAV